MLIYLRIVKKETALVLPYVVIIKKILDVQLGYHSQFRISVILEEREGFHELPKLVSYKSSRLS